MKTKELRTIWKLAKNFWISAAIFWIIETILFLIIEGWHYEATNTVEKWCDKVVLNSWNFALWLTIVVCLYSLLNLTKKLK